MLLRSYRKQPPTRVQRCSRCSRMGHNALSKSCPARIPVPVEDAVQVDGGPVPDEGDGGGDVEGGRCG